MRSLLLLAALGCGADSPTPAEPAPPEPTVDPEAEAMALAKESAKTLGTTLKAKVLEGLAGGDPAATLEMCSQEAQGLTALAATGKGVRVGRSSDKLRNPVNKAPAWVAEWYATIADTPPAEIEPLETISTWEGDPVAQFAAPIVIAEPCLVCHGTPDAAVQAALDAQYPEDAATGYAVGELRGAIWAQALISTP